MSESFLSMTPEQIAKDLMSGMATTDPEAEETKGEHKEKSDIPPSSGADGDSKLATDSQQPTAPTDSSAPAPEGITPGDAPKPSDPGASTEERPLNLDEVQDVSSDAFKEAYDYYKKTAVGDAKTREEHLLKLRNELAEYQEGEDGAKSVTRGLLKNFTDENYTNSLAAGQNVVESTLKQLSEATYPDFDAFKVAREKAAADVHAKLQKNVAYPELSERLLKGLEELSTKMQLKFNVSAAEKEKEQLLTVRAKKNIEQQKKSIELKKALMNSQQLKTNVEQEKRLLAEQNEKLYREWKSKMDLESKLREQQIVQELKAGFEDRANRLRAEFASTQNQTVQMMMQMQKESLESQTKLTQFIMAQKQQQQQQQSQAAELRNPPGLLTSILTPVADLVGGLLGKLL